MKKIEDLEYDIVLLIKSYAAEMPGSLAAYVGVLEIVKSRLIRVAVTTEVYTPAREVDHSDMQENAIDPNRCPS